MPAITLRIDAAELATGLELMSPFSESNRVLRRIGIVERLENGASNSYAP
jgi:hypothetical protein